MVAGTENPAQTLRQLRALVFVEAGTNLDFPAMRTYHQAWRIPAVAHRLKRHARPVALKFMPALGFSAVLDDVQTVIFECKHLAISRAPAHAAEHRANNDKLQAEERYYWPGTTDCKQETDERDGQRKTEKNTERGPCRQGSISPENNTGRFILRHTLWMGQFQAPSSTYPPTAGKLIPQKLHG